MMWRIVSIQLPLNWFKRRHGHTACEHAALQSSQPQKLRQSTRMRAIAVAATHNRAWARPQVLRALDSNGALLAAAAPPLRAYLRSRPDTIRTVVRFLTKVRPHTLHLILPGCAVAAHDTICCSVIRLA